MTIKRLALFTILLTYLLIVFGGYVASSKSGMGCGPEWPLCNGQVVPILQGDTLIEFTHRFIGAILGVSSVILFIKIVRSTVSPAVKKAGYWMLALLIIQILLGAWVVLQDLPTSIIASHLVISVLFMASLIWIWRRHGENTDIHPYSSDDFLKKRMVKRHVSIVLILLILTFVFGAYVKHESLGMVCGPFGCRNSFLPQTGLEWIQTLHRGLAFISGLYIFFLTFWSFKKEWGVQLQNRLIFSGITVLLQIVLGILTIVMGIDITWAMLHYAAGALLFALAAEAWVFVDSAAFLKMEQSVVTDRTVTNKTDI